MTESKSLLAQNLLALPGMHQQWERDYRTSDNESFYEQAFDYIVSVLEPAPGATFLDVGCGSCARSVRLARRGFNVQAVDFSESALGMAREYVQSRGLEDRITLRREGLLELSFPDASFDYVLCWGVLMHIPEVARAMSEIARVIKPGGSLVVSEANKSSLEAIGARNLKRLLHWQNAHVKATPEGVEYWKEKGGAMLVTREASISWLVRSFEACGLTLSRHTAGQFSESYTRVSTHTLIRLIHGLNRFWFHYVRWPGPAFGNLLFFPKRKQVQSRMP